MPRGDEPLTVEDEAVPPAGDGAGDGADPGATTPDEEQEPEAGLDDAVLPADEPVVPAEDEDAAGEEPDEEPDEEETESPVVSLPPAMCRMLFVDIVLTLPSTHPVIVLQESDVPYRELRIPIGGPEGIAIAYAARRLATPRPLTHALMTRLIESFDLTLDVVRITSAERGHFRAEIDVSGPTGSRTLDCRPSDAVALALSQRTSVPIMAAPEVLDAAASGAAGSN